MDNLPSLAPRNCEEARVFAQFIAKTQFVPDAYRGKPDEILACIQYGSEVGLSAMQSLQNIAVINGRPSMWGDVMLALVQQSGKLEYIDETETTDTAVCEVKRKGDPKPRTVKWSAADTQRAGLTNKDNHKSYPARMRQMRARGFALRDKFADVLKGLIAREEAIDITPGAELSPVGELTEDETPHAKLTGEDARTSTVPSEVSVLASAARVLGAATSPVSNQPEQIKKGEAVLSTTNGESSAPAANESELKGGEAKDRSEGGSVDRADNAGAASGVTASGSPEDELLPAPMLQAAKILFAGARGTATEKTAALKAVILNYVDVTKLTRAQEPTFTAILRRMQ